MLLYITGIYVRVVILLSYGMHVHDSIISLTWGFGPINLV